MLLMLSHAVCFRHFWTPYFVKGHILRRDMPAFSSSNTPGMYNNYDWRQYYRLDIDGIGGAGGYTYGADRLGYGYYSRYTLYT